MRSCMYEKAIDKKRNNKSATPTLYTMTETRPRPSIRKKEAIFSKIEISPGKYVYKLYENMLS